MKTIFAAITSLILLFSANSQVLFAPASSPATGGNPQSVAALDINGDGWLDLVSADDNDNTLTVFINNHIGGFVFAYKISTSSPERLTAVDVNGDHLLDLVCGNYYPNTISVFTNNGAGGFILKDSPAVGATPTGVVATDVNGDGKIDLISVNSVGNTLSILTNDGTGNFVLTSSPAVAASPSTAAALDINGDGKMDIVCPSAVSNLLSVLTNDGNGGFKLAFTRNVGSAPGYVIATDVNGDGKLDIVCANNGGNTLSILTNDGAGGLILSSSPVVGNSPIGIVAADFNGDGKMDLACVNYSDSTVSILTNNGSGGFALAATLGVGYEPVGLVAADVNNDGKPDLISANSGSSTLTILTNGTLFPSPIIVTSQPTNKVVADFGTATFAVMATGYPAPMYQWTFNGTNIPGATSNTFSIARVQLTNCGNYQVVVSNGYSLTNSAIAMLDMSPTILIPFAGASTVWGKSTDLSVGAIGSGPLNYQWYLNGTAVNGATNANLDFSSIQFTNGGFYTVVISSPYGNTTNTAEQVAISPSTFTLGFSPTLTVSGVVGYTYVIQSSTNLTSTNNWITLTNLTLTSPTQLFVDTNINASSPANPQHFYRILPGQ